jgi:hypothetical protein
MEQSESDCGEQQSPRASTSHTSHTPIEFPIPTAKAEYERALRLDPKLTGAQASLDKLK